MRKKFKGKDGFSYIELGSDEGKFIAGLYATLAGLDIEVKNSILVLTDIQQNKLVTPDAENYRDIQVSAKRLYSLTTTEMMAFSKKLLTRNGVIVDDSTMIRHNFGGDKIKLEFKANEAIDGQKESGSESGADAAT